MPSEGSTIEHGMLVRQWKWPLRVVFWWLMIAGCVTIYAASAQAWWAWRRAPEAMLAHASQVLAADLATLQALDAVLFEPAEIADWIFRTIHDNVIGATVGIARALMDWPARFKAKQQGQHVPDSAGREHVDAALREPGETVELIATLTRIFAVRTAICSAAAPALLLALAVGAADGLVARARRKACAGRESASLYHRAKLGISLIAILGYLFVLGVPQLDSPSQVLLPVVVLMGWLLRLQCTFYKKYL